MNNIAKASVIRVAVAGLGTIGQVIVRKVAGGEIPGMILTAVATRDSGKAKELLRRLECHATVSSFGELPKFADLVVECAPASLVSAICRPMLEAGKKVMVLSVGALLDAPDLVDIARRNGGQIVVPTGALLGLDAVSAAAEGTIHSVRMISRKPVKGLLGAPYLDWNGISIEGITAPLKIFEGTAREAAKGFPANLNVAAALSLAGIGADRTIQEIWADPTLDRNTHHIVVESDSAHLEMKIENVPSENPKTGRITALSVVAALRKMNAPLRVST